MVQNQKGNTSFLASTEWDVWVGDPADKMVFCWGRLSWDGRGTGL